MHALRIIVVAGFITLAGAASANAADVEVRSVTVRYGDLDLDNPADAAVMVRRIDDAAERACGGAPDLRTYGRLTALLEARAQFAYCRKAAIRDALRRVGSLQVDTAYRSAGEVRLG